MGEESEKLPPGKVCAGYAAITHHLGALESAGRYDDLLVHLDDVLLAVDDEANASRFLQSATALELDARDVGARQDLEVCSLGIGLVEGLSRRAVSGRAGRQGCPRIPTFAA